MRITLGNTGLTGSTDDNATARELAEQLPLTLTFRDHNNVEKTAPLSSRPSTTMREQGTIPGRRHRLLGPDGDLVFYYDDGAPFFDGICVSEKSEGDDDALERQNEDVEATISEAD